MFCAAPRSLRLLVATLAVGVLPALAPPVAGAAPVAGASPQSGRSAQAPPCAAAAAPPAAVDTSEKPAPGQSVPPPLPVPAQPVGGPLLGGCATILPPGAPPLPAGDTAASWVVQNLDTGDVVAAKDPHARERPASLIKTLLALVVVTELKPDQIVVPPRRTPSRSAPASASPRARPTPSTSCCTGC